jgi:hypothetical protein
MVNLEDYSLHLIQNQEYESDSGESDYYNYYNYNNIPGRKKNDYLNFDDWVTVYSDDLYYIWNIIKEYTTYNVPILDQIDYYKFVIFCFENSSKSTIPMSRIDNTV